MEEEFKSVFIDVVWKHDFEMEPIRLLSQLDGERYELRKLEIFRDGRVGYADHQNSVMGTQLGTLPVPSLAEINADTQFEARYVEPALFGSLWSHHVSIPQG